jgi:hypothetical protein
MGNPTAPEMAGTTSMHSGKLRSSIKKGIYDYTLPFRRFLFTGSAYYCPLCESWLRRFLPTRTRPNSWCPVCRSVHRHRLVWLFLQRKTDLLIAPRKRLLHVAPELGFERRFRQFAHLDYLSADLHNPRAMVKMDITDIQYPDGSFDTIYCSHVLEHVLDDRQAMREFYRVLKPGGWAILMVPIATEPTVEDSSVTDPAERQRLFGRHDHVRRYGPDYVDRLGDAGFQVTVYAADEFIAASDLTRMGLRSDDEVIFCAK